MKKTILLTLALLLFIVSVSFAEEEAPVSKFKSIFKISADVMGDVELSAYGESLTSDADTGLSVTSEFSNSINPNLDIGAGITVQLPRSMEDDTADYFFIPVYGLVRIFPSPEQTPVYFTGQAGWNYFNGNESDVDYSGGLYIGAGVGYMNDKFLVEVMYSNNSGAAEGEVYDDYYIYDVEVDVDYSKISLSVGLIF